MELIDVLDTSQDLYFQIYVPWSFLLSIVWVSEGVSDCCLTSTQQFCKWNHDETRFVLDQHASLDCYSASSLNQQSADRHIAALGHIILIRAIQSLVILLNTACNKYLISYSIWFDWIGTRTHDLPHSSRVR